MSHVHVRDISTTIPSDMCRLCHLIGHPYPPHHIVPKMSATDKFAKKYYNPAGNKKNDQQADKERKEVGAEPAIELAPAGGISESRAKSQVIGVHLAKVNSDLST